VHNFIEFIANGWATPGLADALAQAEQQVKTFSADVASMEAAKDHAFTPPPRALDRGAARRTHASLSGVSARSGSGRPSKSRTGNRPEVHAVHEVDGVSPRADDCRDGLWRKPQAEVEAAGIEPASARH